MARIYINERSCALLEGRWRKLANFLPSDGGPGTRGHAIIKFVHLIVSNDMCVAKNMSLSRCFWTTVLIAFQSKTISWQSSFRRSAPDRWINSKSVCGRCTRISEQFLPTYHCMQRFECMNCVLDESRIGSMWIIVMHKRSKKSSIPNSNIGSQTARSLMLSEDKAVL